MGNWARCRQWKVTVDPAKISVECWAQNGGPGNPVTGGFGENERGRNKTAQWSIESNSEGEVIGGLEREVLSFESGNMIPLEENGSQWIILSGSLIF